MKVLQISAVLFLSLFWLNCSSARTDVQNNQGDDKKNVKVLIFDRSEDGKDVSYRAEFKNDKLVNIERNGTKVKEEDMDKYSDLVYDELSNINETHFDFGPGRHKVVKFKHFQDSTFTFHFPDSTFTSKMEKMSRKLSKLNKIQININGLDDLEGLKELDSLDVPMPPMDIDVHVDFDKLRSDLEKVKDELEKLKQEFRAEKKKSK